eukprot:7762148-Ditylum_brightwellii.AAC.1
MPSNTTIATLRGRGGGHHAGGRGCSHGHGHGHGGNKWKAAASNKKKSDSKSKFGKPTVPSTNFTEGYPPKSNNIIESLFEKHVAPLTELLQSASSKKLCSLAPH